LRVELRFAPLPWIGALAWHYWFVVSDDTGRHRWEVWQTKNAGGWCIGHVHRDLKRPEDGVGGGPSRLAREWDGENAARILAVLKTVQDYPYCQKYRYWPGPNSNTFVAWVLRQAGIEHALDPRGLGRNYLTAKQ
jgi:Protein of unknown function (DUF3750)